MSLRRIMNLFMRIADPVSEPTKPGFSLRTTEEDAEIAELRAKIEHYYASLAELERLEKKMSTEPRP